MIKKEKVKVMVVMDREFQQKLKAEAEKEGRSMSNYSLRMIQKSMRESKVE